MKVPCNKLYIIEYTVSIMEGQVNACEGGVMGMRTLSKYSWRKQVIGIMYSHWKCEQKQLQSLP